jgi:orc1/cdc6 family replication initiation protein
MITDARVLQPEFIPQEVKHRDGEINYLTSTLRPILQQDPADPAFLYGPSGVGKTCLAQFTVERLREHMVELNHQYVNCWEDYSRFKTLYTLLDGIKNTIDIHRQSTPRDVLLDRLRDYNGPPYVVILDEVDQLEDKSLLYDLYRIPDLTMILIANSEDGLFNSVNDRLASRLTDATRIHFQAYSDNELVAILQDRVRWGLANNVIDERRLRTIANNAGGDARVAIGILRKAAHSTQEHGRSEITTDVIRKAVPEAKTEIKQQTTDKLTEHQQTVYDIIASNEGIGGGELYEKYCREVGDPKTRRTVRNYVSKLEQYNLVVADGNTKARVYRPIT